MEEKTTTRARPKVRESDEVVQQALRDRILGLDDRQYEVVHVPEWGMDIRVRGLTGTERDAWEASLLQELPGGRGRTRMDYSDVRAKLIVRSVVDEDGERVFSDRDVHALGSKAASALQRIFEVCQKLSRLTDEDVEELTGESKGAQNGASGSSSPLPTESQ